MASTELWACVCACFFACAFAFFALFFFRFFCGSFARMITRCAGAPGAARSKYIGSITGERVALLSTAEREMYDRRINDVL